MADSTLLDNASKISDIITASAAVAALIGAYIQIKVGRTCQREATASDLYGNYLTLAVEYPMLASGYISIQQEGGQPNEQFERYEWFVSVMLHAFEQILDLTDDATWKQAISDQLQYHKNYLMSKRFVTRHYSDALKRLFSEIK